MAMPFNFHANVADTKARQRVERLRRAGKMVEARVIPNSLRMGVGATVLTDAIEADINGDDQRFASKPDPRY